MEKIQVLKTETICVDHFPNEHFSDRLIITFTERGNRSLDIDGFGVKFLNGLGFSVIAVKTNTDLWYENLSSSNLDQINKYINQLGGNFQFRIGYGSSMGGYAAMRFSKYLRLTHVIAISPLYDIKSDFDKRWANDAKFMDASVDMMKSEFLSHHCEYFIITDTKSPDNEHLLKYKRITTPNKLTIVPTPYSGHPSGYMLSDIGALKPLVEMYLKSFSASLKIQEYKSAKKTSESYLFNLSKALLEKKKPKVAIAINSILLSLENSNPEYHLQAGKIYEKLGNIEKAIFHISISAILRPHNPHFGLYRDLVLKRHWNANNPDKKIA
ncbi:MAG: tetratricopeptide repeat protein [Acidovorax defluvii]